MITRLIKTARSLQIFREIGQIPPNQRSGKELPPRLIVQECFNWSNTDTWRVTWEMIKLLYRRLKLSQWRHQIVKSK